MKISCQAVCDKNGRPDPSDGRSQFREIQPPGAPADREREYFEENLAGAGGISLPGGHAYLQTSR
jgi:hypothetical protein